MSGKAASFFPLLLPWKHKTKQVLISPEEMKRKYHVKQRYISEWVRLRTKAGVHVLATPQSIIHLSSNKPTSWYT